VDEVNLNARRKRTRVLRAADVIPPFDKVVERQDTGGTPRREAPLRVGVQTEPVATGPRGNGNGARRGPAGDMGPAGGGAEGVPPLAGEGEIPQYDLAVNILAEQRRVAARRRRAPGQAQDRPLVSSEGPDPAVLITETASQELLELQRVVAEIVARDIERLCRGPNRASTL
jgi:hypothetical protein